MSALTRLARLEKRGGSDFPLVLIRTFGQVPSTPPTGTIGKAVTRFGTLERHPAEAESAFITRAGTAHGGRA